MCNKFRTLNANEIECRVAQAGTRANGAWASILIYKDARVDQKLLDEVIGPMNWKNDYAFIDGNLYCTVSIWDSEKKEWVSKQNVGTESNTEKEKGQASDAFKRACFNWGIGRELYSAPKIFIDLNPGEYSLENGKVRCKAVFSVKEISYDGERKVNRLVVVDRAGNIRFGFNAATAAPAAQVKTAKPSPKPECPAKIWWKLVRMDVEGVRSMGDDPLTGLEYLKRNFRTDEVVLAKFNSDVQMTRDARETQDFLDLDESSKSTFQTKPF